VKGRLNVAKDWLEHYDSGVPCTLEPYPEKTLLDVVHDAAAQRPEHPALLFKGAQMSYRKLERLSDALAAALVAQGVEKGDRVAILLPNCPQFLIGQLAAWKAGAVVVPVSPLFAEPEVQRTLADCGAKAVLVLTPFYERIKTVQPRTSLICVIATNIKEYLPPHLRVAFSLLKEKKEGHQITLRGGDLWLAELLRRFADRPRPAVPVGPQDPALFIYTGGTTGTPKAAVGTHQALLIAAMQLHAWISPAIDDWDDVAIGNMPMFHIYGAVNAACSLVGHNPIALIPNPRDFNDVVATIQKVRPAILPGVPTLYIALLNHPKVRAGKVDFRSIKLCCSAAAPLMVETKNRFEQLTGGRIIEGYSLTESMVAAVMTPMCGMYKPGSVGVPLPDVEVRITDAETGLGILPHGQIGEIVIRARQVMQGYWQRPEETANVIREGPVPGSGERWLYTGDLGYLDEDGYMFIVDRKKDLLKPGGKQVWPREVEEAIASHPAVAEVGVWAVPDDLLGEAVKAWVVLRAGQHASAAELLAHCGKYLADYKVPKHVEFRDSLPKTAIGKLQRRELVRQDVASRSSPAPKQSQAGTESRPRAPVALPAPSLLAS
jgi:long-chain acyl-CoA synthetase